MGKYHALLLPSGRVWLRLLPKARELLRALDQLTKCPVEREIQGQSQSQIKAVRETERET